MILNSNIVTTYLQDNGCKIYNLKISVLCTWDKRITLEN